MWSRLDVEDDEPLMEGATRFLRDVLLNSRRRNEGLLLRDSVGDDGEEGGAPALGIATESFLGEVLFFSPSNVYTIAAISLPFTSSTNVACVCDALNAKVANFVPRCVKKRIKRFFLSVSVVMSGRLPHGSCTFMLYEPFFPLSTNPMITPSLPAWG